MREDAVQVHREGRDRAQPRTVTRKEKSEPDRLRMDRALLAQ